LHGDYTVWIMPRYQSELSILDSPVSRIRRLGETGESVIKLQAGYAIEYNERRCADTLNDLLQL